MEVQYVPRDRDFPGDMFAFAVKTIVRYLYSEDWKQDFGIGNVLEVCAQIAESNFREKLG